MRIGYLGAGTWGFALASVLASNGHEVVVWARDSDLANALQIKRVHPKLPQIEIPENVLFTPNIKETLQGAEIIVESVTSSGIRPVFELVHQYKHSSAPIILTS